jgi:hypothetical protein
MSIEDLPLFEIAKMSGKMSQQIEIVVSYLLGEMKLNENSLEMVEMAVM